MSKRKMIGGLGLLALLTVIAFSLLLQGRRVAAQTTANPSVPSSIYQTQLSSAHYSLDWNVASSGGGPIGSTNYKVNSTIGQPTVATSSGSNFEVHSGFWQGMLDTISKIFLPMITKG